MNIHRDTIEVADGRLYCESAGRGPALVLIHGFSGDCRAWDDVFAPLAEHYRVIRYDLRGYGRSTLPTAPYAHADDLAVLLDRLGVERAAVVGMSMGGWIATHFALAHPRRVSALVAVSSALIGWEWSPDWKQLWSAIAAQAQTSVEAAKALWLRHPLFAPACERPELARRLAAAVADYSGWHWRNRDPQRAIDVPDMQRLHEIAVPTLVVTGGRDMADFHDIAAVLRDNIPAARSLDIAEAGHMINVEAPAQLVAATRALLEEDATR